MKHLPVAFRICLTTLWIVAVCVSVAVAQDDESSAKAERRKEVVAALKFSARRGVAGAQAELGLYYLSGIDPVSKDEERAVELFRQAAEQGHHDGQYVLGHCLRRGIGTEQDLTEARKYFLLAAEQAEKKKDGRAFYDLGAMAEAGEGVEQNVAIAIDYWRKGRELGEARCCHNLGHKYFNGIGVRRSVLLAMQCFEEAMDESPPSIYMLGLCYLQPEVVVRIGDTKSREMAIKYLRLSASRGNPFARARLEELGVRQD